MLSDRISMLFDLLGCNNSDIARAIDCSPSNISRIHSGKRTHKPQDRPILRLADGVYTFADENNMLASLGTLCRTDSDSRDVIIPALVAWLFDTDEASLPQIIIPTVRKKKAEQMLKTRSFGEKLNEIMNLLEMSNMRLARQINIDASHISRFRNGVRSPRSNTALSESLAKVLIKRAVEQNRIQTISKLTAIPADILIDEEEGLAAFSAWLYDISGDTDTSDIDKLLDCIDSFSTEAKTPLPALSSFLTDKITESSATEYWGVEGLREAVMRFLGNTAKNGGELWLYSDEDIDWMVGDKSFFAKWYTLMVACVKRGVKIRVIHNLDRGTEEMISAIRSWMPLYMSGMIESYVCRRGRDPRFTHTIFLRPGAECIYASHIKGTEANGWYEYLTERRITDIVCSEYECLLCQAEPLVRIYIGNNDRLFEEKHDGDLSSVLSSLSLGTMPDMLLSSILKRNGISGQDFTKIKNFCKMQKEKINQALDHGNVFEFSSLPTDEELFSGKVRVNLSSSLCETNLFYTPEEYAEHIRAVSALIDKSTSYHFFALPELPFNDIQIIKCDGRVAVIRSKQPYAAFVFTEPMMLRAFDAYFDTMKKRYKCDRSDVRRTLIRFL